MKKDISITKYKKVVVQFTRGFLENNGTDFNRIVMKGLDDYDYTNYTRGDLLDLRDAINEFLKETENQTV